MSVAADRPKTRNWRRARFSCSSPMSQWTAVTNSAERHRAVQEHHDRGRRAGWRRSDEPLLTWRRSGTTCARGLASPQSGSCSTGCSISWRYCRSRSRRCRDIPPSRRLLSPAAMSSSADLRRLAATLTPPARSVLHRGRGDCKGGAIVIQSDRRFVPTFGSAIPSVRPRPM